MLARKLTADPHPFTFPGNNRSVSLSAFPIPNVKNLTD